MYNETHYAAPETFQQAPQRVEPIIESASATTDPENCNSGPAAYVIFGCAAVLLVVLALGLSSCIGAVSQLALSGADTSYGYGYGDPYYDDYGFDDFGFDDFGVEFEYNLNSGLRR